MHFRQFRFAPTHPQVRPLPLIAITAFALWIAGASFATVQAQGATEFEPIWFMVIDRASLLNEDQEVSAINDTWRLNQLGIPAQVVTEVAASTPELARQRAEALRLEHAIETSPGAGDGILIYAAVDPAKRSLVTIAISTGPNALPSGGLTPENLESIQSRIVVPQLAAGSPARAIVYAVREMIYQQVFTPPPAVSLTGWRASINALLPWVAPAIAIPVAVVSLRNIQDRRGMQPVLKRAALALVVGMVLAVIAVAVKSAPGVFWAIGLLLASVTVMILGDRHLSGVNHHPPAANGASRTPRLLESFPEAGS